MCRFMNDSERQVCLSHHFSNSFSTIFRPLSETFNTSMVSAADQSSFSISLRILSQSVEILCYSVFSALSSTSLVAFSASCVAFSTARSIIICITLHVSIFFSPFPMVIFAFTQVFSTFISFRPRCWKPGSCRSNSYSLSASLEYLMTGRALRSDCFAASRNHYPGSTLAPTDPFCNPAQKKNLSIHLSKHLIDGYRPIPFLRSKINHQCQNRKQPVPPHKSRFAKTSFCLI